MAKQKDDGYVRFRCKMCGSKLKVKKTSAGGNVVPCPSCGETVVVPFGDMSALAEARELTDDSDRKNVALDPDALVGYLEEADKAFQAKEQPSEPPAGAAWRSKRAFTRVDELDNLRQKLNGIEDETVETLQRMLRQEDVPEDQLSREVDNISSQRRQQIGQLLGQRRLDLTQKLEKLKAVSGRLKPLEQERIGELERALRVLDLYVSRVLGLKPR